MTVDVDIQRALLILETSRPAANSGPVNPRLLEQACNIGTVALEALLRLTEERDDLRQQLESVTNFNFGGSWPRLQRG